MTKFLNISTDSTLAGNSDETVVSEKAIKAYADTKLKSGDNVSELTNDAGYLVMGDLTGFVTRTTAQTISGLKTFTADIALSGTTSIKNTTSGVSYTMLYRDTSGIHVGTSTQALLLAGSGTCPTFNGNNVAMSADIPTVNNPTITITQGGVTKGSFTLNQASGDTIALDAGGSSYTAGNGISIDANNEISVADPVLVNQTTSTSSGIGKPLYILNVGKGVGVNLQDSESCIVGSTNYHPGNYGTSFGIKSGAQSGTATRGVMIGYSQTVTATGAIQIGGYSANNPDANTFKVANTNGNFEIMSADGTIPEARLADTTSAAQGQVLTLDSNLNAVWAAGGGGSVAIDNTTITENASNEIQAVAVIDQNTGIAKTWTGTQAEYDAIVTKDPETEYIITDDIGGSATVIAELAEAVNDKVDKGHQVVEFQAPTALNGYTWYRKYADGWVEQGGINNTLGSNTISITYPIVMANANFKPIIEGESDYGAQIFAYVQQLISHTTTGFETRGKAVGASNAVWENTSFVWFIAGMAA